MEGHPNNGLPIRSLVTSYNAVKKNDLKRFKLTTVK